MGQIQLLLAALAYPHAEAFDLSDDVSFRKLVVWLENMKIRQYEVNNSARRDCQRLRVALVYIQAFLLHSV